MRNFMRGFERERECVWRCKSFTSLNLPNGHKIEIAPGTVLTCGSRFMGLDIADMLEEQYRQDTAPPHITSRL